MSSGRSARALAAAALAFAADPAAAVAGWPPALRGAGRLALLAAARLQPARRRRFEAERAAGRTREEALLAAWPVPLRRFPWLTPEAYARWIARNEPPPAAVQPGPDGPLISILTPVREPPPRELGAAISSVLAQTYPRWRLLLALDGPPSPAIERVLEQAGDPRIRVLRLAGPSGVAIATNAALAAAEGDICLFMDHDDLLSPGCLAAFADIFRDQTIMAAYSDEDVIDAGGRRREPAFKTGFDRERLLAHNYVNHAFAARTEALRAVGGIREGFDGAQDHDLVLRLSEREDTIGIVHVPQILYHWRLYPGGRSLSQRGPERAAEARRRAVAGHLARRGLEASVEAGALGCNKIVWTRTTLRFAVVRPGVPADPEAEILAFLAPGAAPVGDALEALAALAARPDVGAVGGKLVGPDGRLYGAGLAADGRPVLAGAPADAAGPQDMLAVTREVAAVPWTALVVERRKWLAAGSPEPGDDAAALAFCQALAARGWRTLWTPDAVLALR